MAGSGSGRGRGEEGHYRRAAMFHPLRQRIARLLSGGLELAPGDLSAKLEQPLGRTAYHLHVLARRRVLKVVPKRRRTSPPYRWSEDARWAREMLVEEDE
jgi:hypothetical protein